MSEPAPSSQAVVTVEEFTRFPFDELLMRELLGGVVYTSPRPRPRHMRAEAALTSHLGGSFDYDPEGPGGWWILPEALVRWTAFDCTAPDLSGWRRERVPVFPETLPITVTPDWVCEVLSSRTVRRDRTYKTDLYAKCGVQHLWIVEPVSRTLEAYQNDGGLWMRLGAWGDDAKARIPPFEALVLDVGTLFPDRRDPDVVAEEEAAAWGP